MKLPTILKTWDVVPTTRNCAIRSRWLHENRPLRRAQDACIKLQITISEAPEWQPIETAPKDGTLLLISGASGYVIHTVFAVSAYWNRDRAQWYAPDCEPWEDCVWGAPTHWRSLSLPGQERAP